MQEGIFGHQNPATVHDVLWSWSTGHRTTAEAVHILSLVDETELHEAAANSGVPVQGKNVATA
jgi:hypothetical protein